MAFSLKTFGPSPKFRAHGRLGLLFWIPVSTFFAENNLVKMIVAMYFKSVHKKLRCRHARGLNDVTDVKTFMQKILCNGNCTKQCTSYITQIICWMCVLYLRFSMLFQRTTRGSTASSSEIMCEICCFSKPANVSTNLCFCLSHDYTLYNMFLFLIASICIINFRTWGHIMLKLIL